MTLLLLCHGVVPPWSGIASQKGIVQEYATGLRGTGRSANPLKLGAKPLSMRVYRHLAKVTALPTVFWPSLRRPSHHQSVACA